MLPPATLGGSYHTDGAIVVLHGAIVQPIDASIGVPLEPISKSCSFNVSFFHNLAIYLGHLGLFDEARAWGEDAAVYWHHLSTKPANINRFNLICTLQTVFSDLATLKLWPEVLAVQSEATTLIREADHEDQYKQWEGLAVALHPYTTWRYFFEEWNSGRRGFVGEEALDLFQQLYATDAYRHGVHLALSLRNRGYQSSPPWFPAVGA